MTIKETIVPAEAARRLGWTQHTVEARIRDGTLWFCLAAQAESGRWSYTIPREAFDRFMRGELQKPATYLEVLHAMERLLQGALVS